MPPRVKPFIVPPGSICTPNLRKRGSRPPHAIEAPQDDAELQDVYAWLTAQELDITTLLRTAVDDAIRHVLDSARTRRFYLMAPDVDGDERSTVGTKLQYYVVDELELIKQAPLDTVIAGVAVEIKTTTRSAVMVPPEGQCEVTLIIQVDAWHHRFRALLMRTHRAWLGGGEDPKQRDKKRSPYADAMRAYALPVVPWTGLTPEPLRLLSPEQVAEVLDMHLGVRERATALFRYLPEVTIPRRSLEVVGAGRADFMKRMREAKPYVWHRYRLHVLVGTWTADRDLGQRIGFDLSGEAWVSVTPERFERYGVHQPPEPPLPDHLWPADFDA